MSPRISLQFIILTQVFKKYNIFTKVYRDKIINSLTFKIKCVKVLNGEELQYTEYTIKTGYYALKGERCAKLFSHVIRK